MFLEYPQKKSLEIQIIALLHLIKTNEKNLLHVDEN